jgi:hypothetical protein
VTCSNWSVEGEEVFGVVEVFPLDRVEEGLSQLLLSQSQHKKNVITVGKQG